MRYNLVNFFLLVFPSTRFFECKRWLLNLLGVKVGAGSKICGGVAIYGPGNVIIGDNCWIGINTKFYLGRGGDVEIGSNCDIAPQVVFMSGTHDFGGPERRAGHGKGLPIRIGDGCWLGMGSSVLAGCSIGVGVIAGANTTFLGKSYTGNKLYVGQPAAAIKELEA